MLTDDNKRGEEVDHCRLTLQHRMQRSQPYSHKPQYYCCWIAIWVANLWEGSYSVVTLEMQNHLWEQHRCCCLRLHASYDAVNDVEVMVANRSMELRWVRHDYRQHSICWQLMVQQ